MIETRQKIYAECDGNGCGECTAPDDVLIDEQDDAEELCEALLEKGWTIDGNPGVESCLLYCPTCSKAEE